MTRRFSVGTIGVQQGSVLLFSDFSSGGPMWTGEGPRERRSQVTFPDRYEDAPAVIVGLSMWDIHHERNARVHLAAESVTEWGFELVFRTWGDSRIARIRADWTAIGAMPDETWEDLTPPDGQNW